jgi:hypothetical protein
MGHIRQRGKRSWELKFDIGRDPKTGKRQVRYHSFKGSKREAQAELTRLMAKALEGAYVDPNKLTIASHVRARIQQWESSGDISEKTAERYRELLDNQIEPHIGAKLLQKLKSIDIEEWHTALKNSGRKNGKGGLSNRTIGHAHRVLSKALREATRHDLIVKNVAAEEGAPRVNTEEMVILTQLAELPSRLTGRPIRARNHRALHRRAPRRVACVALAQHRS